MQTLLRATSRQTKYMSAALEALRDVTHATNFELLLRVQEDYPEVSATTIHRVTARLRERGVIGCAPKQTNGSERYDINPDPHHHFVCETCDRVCDVPETLEAQAIVEQLKNLSGECALAGTLTMRGICKKCVKGNI